MSDRLPKTTVLKFGSISFKVFSTKDGRVGFRYKIGSEWEQSLRSNLHDLRLDAERIALSLLNGEAAASDIDAQDRRIYIAARSELAPFGIEVDRGARVLAEAARVVGGIDRIAEACRWFSRAQPNLHIANTAEVSAQFVRHLSADGASEIYIRKMEQDLAKFVERFPGEIGACRAGDVDDWLRARPIGSRRRRNLLTKFVTLFNFARERGYLPESLRTEIEKIKRPKIQRKAPAIYTPHEFRLIVQQCYRPADRKSGRKDYADFIPVLAIGAFAGLRWSELMRLDWQRDIHFDHRVIDVGDENKTGHRQPPILPNLATWLSPWRGSVGPVCPFRRPDNVLRRLSARAGLPVGDRRYANALRKSYISYRMAIKKNAALVSEESGHSPAELKKTYLRRQLEAAAIEWFGFKSSAADNIMIMPLFRQQH